MTEKILNGAEKMKRDLFFTICQNMTNRERKMKLSSRYKTNKWKCFFIQRIINLLNSLPQCAVEADSLTV